METIQFEETGSGRVPSCNVQSVGEIGSVLRIARNIVKAVGFDGTSRVQDGLVVRDPERKKTAKVVATSLCRVMLVDKNIEKFCPGHLHLTVEVEQLQTNTPSMIPLMKHATWQTIQNFVVE